MKKYFIIGLIVVLTGLIFCISPVLADEPTDVSVTVESGGDVNATLDLTGSNIDVSVNGEGLATDTDIAKLRQHDSLSSMYYNQAIDSQQKLIQGLIDDLTQLKDNRVALDETAIAKLITELQATQSALSEAQSQIDNISTVVDNNTQKTIQVQDNLSQQISDASAQISSVQGLLSSLQSDTDTRIKNLGTVIRMQMDDQKSLREMYTQQQAQIDDLVQQNKDLQRYLSNMKMGVIIGFIIVVVLGVTFGVVWKKKMVIK